MNERLDASVRGNVQGVGFRWFVVRHAARLGLTGWTSNEPNGSVRVVAEGPTSALDELARHLQAGPAGASVVSVDVNRSPAQGDLGAFTIHASGHRGD